MLEPPRQRADALERDASPRCEHDGHGQTIFKDIEGEWITRLSDMPTVTINAFIKKVNMSKADAADLKKVRRQRKNKVYTKNSRERRAGKRQSQPRPVSPTEELARSSPTEHPAGAGNTKCYLLDFSKCALSPERARSPEFAAEFVASVASEQAVSNRESV